MSRNIKCPHCHESFPLGEGLKEDLENLKKEETKRVQNQIRTEESKKADKKYQSQLNEANKKLNNMQKKKL